jgi:hypothetical protein
MAEYPNTANVYSFHLLSWKSFSAQRLLSGTPGVVKSAI